MKTALPLLIVLFLASCNSPDSKTPGDPAQNDTIAKEENATTATEADPESAKLLPVCQRFYDEICMSQLDSPRPVVNEKGYYVLDLTTHKLALQKKGMFTDNFIAMQDDVFAECRNALEKEQLTEADTEEGIDMNAPLPCSFFHYAYYFQAQEYPDNFRLKNALINGNAAFTELHFYNGNRDWDDLVYLEIRLKDQNGKWLIDKVEKKLND